MGPEELDNPSRNELFEMLKGKCKTRAKRDIYDMLVCLVLILVPFYYSGSSGWNRRNREIIEELQELVEKE